MRSHETHTRCQSTVYISSTCYMCACACACACTCAYGQSICHEKYLKFKPIVKAPRTYLLRSLQGWVLLLVLQVAYQGIHFLCSALTCPVQARPCVYRFSYYVSYCDPHNKRETIFVSCDIVQIQVHDDTRILFARAAPPEGERRRRCVGRAAFRSTSTLSAKANGFVWLGGGRRSCGMVIGPQDCHCDLAALPPQRDCGRGQTCGHDSFLDRREAACRRRVRV